jgi:hypothetical protein
VTDLSFHRLLADAGLACHVTLVVFVVGGLPLIVLGHLRRWAWVDAPWFRLAHLATIAVVAAEAWLGLVCPLTTLEMSLRAKAQGPTYAGSFVEHWLQRLLFWEAPAWVFTLAYSLFGLAVIATWIVLPPRWRARPAARA